MLRFPDEICNFKSICFLVLQHNSDDAVSKIADTDTETD